MRIKQETLNGNINSNISYGIPVNSRSEYWSSATNQNREKSYINTETQNLTNTQKKNIISNRKIGYRRNQCIIEDNNFSSSFPLNKQTTDFSPGELICNKQYRINANNLNNLNRIDNLITTTVEGNTRTTLSPCNDIQDNINISSQVTPLDEERAFEHSDTDETSENGIQKPLPRGIVNPNYPGFQHLAHTLQDYSSTIENFYPSENDMTDDDIDVDIPDASYEPEPDQQQATNIINLNVNNNNNNNDENEINDDTLSHVHDEINSRSSTCDIQIIPDLLKNVTKNINNADTIDFEINCSNVDIENNFKTKNIIGDFNKEIENEIKQLLNYNINIEDDLEELRKDIKDTFAKPIENTINNISEVVNHVIKKLVETQLDVKLEYKTNSNCIDLINPKNEQLTNDENEINRQNEKNIRKEMHLSRPTFLLLNTDYSKITDAFLSNGKDEINIDEHECNTEELSANVENTIKQLSTELRKIIPTIEGFRESDKYWQFNKNDKSVTTDGNFNEIAGSSKAPASSVINYDSASENSEHNKEKQLQNKEKTVIISKRGNSDDVNKSYTQKFRFDTKTSRDRGSDGPSNVCSKGSPQDRSSVRSESVQDYDLGSFDVYNIETAMPTLDFDAIESHLKAAKEAERRKRNDREEIRRRLATGAESEEYYSMGHTDRPGKKPSLHSRLQGGKNLQICFMNETASDNESQTSDVEKGSSNKSLSRSSIFSKSNYSLNNHPYQTKPLSVSISKTEKLGTVSTGAKLHSSAIGMKTSKSRSAHSLSNIELKESDFYILQATLQTEARIALAQAKEIARIQMQRERRGRAVSPVTEMLRRSMEKASVPLASDRRRLSRQLLTDMNIAQLQVIVNELHSQIESLNESLVGMLMARDELHMGQDSMLVDIEDLTRYLGVKEQTKKTKGNKIGVKRFTSLVSK